MNRYMNLTSNADDQPLYVDTTAPLHVLRDGQTVDPAALQDLAQLCCIPLRDGCDVMDVIARRLDAAPAGSTL